MIKGALKDENERKLEIGDIQKLVILRTKVNLFFNAFQRFGQVKFAYGASVLGLSQFLLLPQLPYKMMLNFKSGQN